RQMDKIDRSSALTATVWLMHEIRRQQTTSFEEGLKEFKEASLVGLATAIEGHERAWNESPSSEAKQELDQLEAALGWLSKYHTALDTVDHDLEEARRLHNALNPETLSWAFREFQNMAHGHRNSLFDRVQDGTARALCRQIEYYCDRRELVEARAALDDLDSRPVPRRVHSEIGDARGRVKRLANEENKRRQFEDKFNRFLEDLRGHMGADAKLSLDLDVLEHAWRTERDRLDTAIEIEPRDELLKRRSTLNLRLGNYGKALKDAQQSLDLQPSPEGFLLSAQARFAQAHGDPEALEDARQSIRLDNQSAPPVYLRGFYRYEKFEAGDSKDTDLLDKAREDLDAVVDTHRLDSAHAYYFLAKIYFELASIALDAKKPNVAIVSADKVIALANRALSAPLTEQEIIVAFGGYKAAVDPGVIKSFQRNIFVVRAEGHLIRKDFQEGIADFDRAISLDEGFADTYFSRALAKGKAGHYADAMLDLAEAEKHAGNDTRLKRLIPKWRKDYKTRLDKGQQ
ncbi:MAG: hypothetical protein O7H41_15095, partial [Planctomycetota bacterium]|nr:hypothetical protein [Planctomycetota bacterium]